MGRGRFRGRSRRYRGAGYDREWGYPQPRRDRTQPGLHQNTDISVPAQTADKMRWLKNERVINDLCLAFSDRLKMPIGFNDGVRYVDKMVNTRWGKRKQQVRERAPVDPLDRRFFRGYEVTPNLDFDPVNVERHDMGRRVLSTIKGEVYVVEGDGSELLDEEILGYINKGYAPKEIINHLRGKTQDGLKWLFDQRRKQWEIED